MIRFDGASHVGMVRKDNQDDFAYHILSDEAAFAVVCDGMGGPGGGRLASKMATDGISQFVREAWNPEMDGEDLRDLLIRACENANAEIYRRSRREPELEGMGTTVVVAFFMSGAAHILHVGDSRAYLIRGGEIRQITNDHSIVQQLVDSGEISPEDARVHPQKNIITRAVGVDGFLTCDYDTVLLEESDTLLLCTDGLTNMVPDATIASIITKNKKPDKLIRAALEAGGNDNVTVVLAYGAKLT